MTAFLTDDTKTILLLCGVFGKEHSVRSLSQGEYHRLARWLINRKMSPKDLLDHKNVDPAANGAGIDRARLGALLERGVSLGFALEEWQHQGIWIASRSDSDYPTRLKKHLLGRAPALLYCTGNRSLLQGGGLAIVGSRNLASEGEAFTKKAAELCAVNHMTVISGGARGVDSIAMIAALEAGGVTIGVLADHLFKKSLERQWRDALAQGHLLLISPYHPNTRFTVGTAMGRNKLIYAMADYGLVVNAEYQKGGTWTGATEELKRDHHRPVFILAKGNIPRGNRELMDLGGLPWPEVANGENLCQRLAMVAAQNNEAFDDRNLPLFHVQKR